MHISVPVANFVSVCVVKKRVGLQLQLGGGDYVIECLVIVDLPICRICRIV